MTTVGTRPSPPVEAIDPVALRVGGRSRQSWLARQRWWIVRVLLLPVHLAIFTVLTFILVRSVPGDPVLAHLGPNYTPEAYDDMQAAMGLSGSVWDQLGAYLGRVLQFDLGESLSTKRPVLEDFATRLPSTLELALMALVGCIVFSLLLSFLAVFRPRWRVSGVIRGYARTAGAIPEFVLAIAALFVFYATLRWAPAPLGRLDSMISTPPPVTGLPFLDTLLTGRFDATVSMSSHLVLPLVVLVLAQSAILTKILVSSLQKSIDTPPTWFRIASGASKPAVVVSVYRRALPPAVTMCGTLFGYLLGGAVVLETLFGFAGMGQYAVTAVTTSDYIAMQGFLLVVAFISLVVFLIVDLANMMLDPRRRPGVRTED